MGRAAEYTMPFIRVGIRTGVTLTLLERLHCDNDACMHPCRGRPLPMSLSLQGTLRCVCSRKLFHAHTPEMDSCVYGVTPVSRMCAMPQPHFPELERHIARAAVRVSS